jgi:hypothetical protein
VTSQEKVRQVVLELVDAQGPPFNAFGRSIAEAKLAELPSDPAELDAQLVKHAQLLLALRSDDAPPANVTIGEQVAA